MPLAVTNYEFSVFLHVTAVVVGFGATFAESVFFPVAMRMSARNLPYVHRLQLVINQFFVLPALVIVVATGIYQMSEGDWDYGDLWVSGTLTIVVIIALTLVFFFIPVDRRLLPMIQQTLADTGDRELTLEDLPKDYARWGRLEGLVGAILGVLLIVAIYFMVTKPGLG
jgi:predicted Kef-type K+ transport protein